MRLRGVTGLRIAGPAAIPQSTAYVSQGMQALCMYPTYFVFSRVSYDSHLAVVFGEIATDLIKADYGL